MNSLFLVTIGLLVLTGIVLMYPWDVMHGGVATFGPLHCESDRISGSLLSGFNVSNLRVKWADLWELEARELTVRLQPSGFLSGRLSITGLMSGYTWRARNRQGTIPDISDDLKSRLERLCLKLRCTDGKVICLVGPKSESRVFTVRNARMTFSGQNLVLKGSVLASGGIPGEFQARVGLGGHLDLELNSKGRTIHELVRLFSLDFPWIERFARGSGEGDLVYAVTGAPGKRKTAGRLQLKTFTGFIGEQLLARELRGETRFVPGQALFDNISGRLGPVLVSSGEGLFSLEEDRWTVHGRAKLSSSEPSGSWRLSGRPGIVFRGVKDIDKEKRPVTAELRLSGEDLVMAGMRLDGLKGKMIFDGTALSGTGITCRIFGSDAVLDLQGSLGEPISWTLDITHLPASRLSTICKNDSLHPFLEYLTGEIALSLKGTIDKGIISSGIDILLPESVTCKGVPLTIGPGLINAARRKIEIRNLAFKYCPVPFQTVSANLFGMILFDDKRSGQWLISPSPCEIAVPAKKIRITGVLSGGGTMDEDNVMVDELSMTFPEDGKLWLRPFSFSKNKDLEVIADIESLPLEMLKSLLPGKVKVRGKVSGNIYFSDKTGKLAGEIMVPTGDVELPAADEKWKYWNVAPLFVSLETDILDSPVSRHRMEAEIRAEDTWGTFALQARLGEQDWWMGEGMLVLTPDKTRDLELDTITPIFKTGDGGVRLPLRLEGGLEIPKVSVNIGQEVGRALVKYPGRLIQSITP